MKAIAIIDINDELLEDYENFAIECDLIATSKKDNSWRDTVKWVGTVKLKPLPKKRKEINDLTVEAYVNDAWNACIDEILGETK